MTDPTSQDVSRWQLEQAIDKLDPARLRDLVVSVYESSEACQKEMVNYLFLGGEDQKGEQENEDARGAKRARLAPARRYERCITCKKTFNVTRNNPKACKTHPGFLDIDDEVFPDDDQVMYDPSSIDPETDWRREEWPEGFIYGCCEKNCNAPGCKVQAHVVDTREAAPTARVEISDEDSDHSDEDEDEDEEDTD